MRPATPPRARVRKASVPPTITSWPGLSRPSTTYVPTPEGVDARHEAGHDDRFLVGLDIRPFPYPAARRDAGIRCARCSTAGDVVGADHVAPQLDLALEQRARGLGRFLLGRVEVHAAIGE